MAATKTKRRPRKMLKKKQSSLIKSYGSFLKGLTHLTPKYRQKMINNSPKEVIDSVGECCLNIIKGNVHLTKAQKQNLQARQRHIHLLSSKQVSLPEKKKIINQKGGALLGLLLKPLLAPIVGSVLWGLLNPQHGRV